MDWDIGCGTEGLGKQGCGDAVTRRRWSAMMLVCRGDSQTQGYQTCRDSGTWDVET